MTYKEARDRLQPVADSTPLAGYGAALSKAVEVLKLAEDGPCGLCAYYPPSSFDGRPCTMCPAVGRADNG
jgi:hypothetical protein